MASKIIYVAAAMVMLNLAMIIFSCSDWDTTTGECIATEPLGTNSTSSLISFMSHPYIAGGDDLWNIFFGSGWGLLAAIGIASAIVIGAIFFKGQEVVWIAMAIGLTSCVYPAIKLWQTIHALSGIGDELSKDVLAIAVVSIIILTVMFTIIDWARGHE